MIAIVNYNAGNIRSVQNALTRLGYDCIVTDDPEKIKAAEKVIFPGVGEAGSAMRYLKKKGLDELLISLKQPVLGICLGQQLFCAFSEEGTTKCMGVFDAQVKRFPKKNIVPHMGWNNLIETSGTLFTGITPQDDVYFVHSFYVETCADTAAVTDYILPFSAALQHKNFYATQFHPEKSGDVGEKIVKNFLKL